MGEIWFIAADSNMVAARAKMRPCSRRYDFLLAVVVVDVRRDCGGVVAYQILISRTSSF